MEPAIAERDEKLNALPIENKPKPLIKCRLSILVKFFLLCSFYLVTTNLLNLVACLVFRVATKIIDIFLV